MKTTKHRKIKVPRLSSNQFHAFLQKAWRVSDTPDIKTIEEKDGIFTALNERGEPVAFFGQAFAKALKEYGALIEAKIRPEVFTCGGVGKFVTPAPASMPPAPQEIIRCSARLPVVRERILLVVAPDYENFRQYIEDHWNRWQRSRCRITYRYVARSEQLYGYQFGRDCRVILREGWTRDKLPEQIREILRMRNLSQLAFRH